MSPQYSVEYSVRLRGHSPAEHLTHFSDDPLACESFLRELLEQGMAIHAIRRDAVQPGRPEFDRLLRLAAAAIAADRVCTSLGIKPEEERHRFGFSA